MNDALAKIKAALDSACKMFPDNSRAEVAVTLLHHPFKTWTLEEKAYLQSEAAPQPATSTTTTTSTFHDPMPLLPASLKSQPRWVLWKMENATKVPYQLSGLKAANNNPQHWAAYGVAARGVTLDENGGLGFVLNGDGIIGIDLDGCRNPQTGEVAGWAKDILSACGNTYAEITPSGTGLRVLARGTIQLKDKMFKLNPEIGYGGKVQVEIYTTGRYFTTTGNAYYSEPRDVQDVPLNNVYPMLYALREKHPAPVHKNAVAGDMATANGGVPIQYERGTTLRTCKYDIFTKGTVLKDEVGFHITNGVGSLTFPSQSEADMSFANVLAVVHECDVVKMEDDLRKSPLMREKWERLMESQFNKAITWAKSLQKNNIPTGVADPQQPAPSVAPAQAAADLAAEASQDAEGAFPFGDGIPDFQDGWITGSFRKMVDAVCGGTTIPVQYVWHASKAMACALLTRYQIVLEDCESARTYFVVFGGTGTGKGLSFRRTQKLVDGVRGFSPFVKIITSIDSQAGIRDAFFEMDEKNNLPILFFANEVKNIGHKSDSKKNPDILDALVELADETTVTVTKAKKSLKAKACRSRDNSWLLAYVCSQDKEAFATAFPRTKDQGLPDRFIPEYSPRIEAGSLPEPNFALGAEGLEEIIKTIQSAKTSGLTLSAEAKATFQEVWNRQEPQYKTSPRFRQQFMLEVYLKAIGEGRTTALPSDVLVASEIVERRKPIRQKFLDEQIPNQAGVYTSRLKAIHADMFRQLRRGIRWETVALSKRDLATMTQAYKEADLSTFNQAWNSMKSFWTPVNIRANNGHTYAKYVPMPEEQDMWLPADDRNTLGFER
jgi:hypothetical protein